MASTPTLVSGMRATGSWVSGREDIQYMQKIALLERWKNPATLLMLHLAVFESKTIEYNHFEDQYLPEYDAINHGAGYLSTDTALVVDDATKFNVGDLIRCERTLEVMLVTAVNETTNTLTVIREAGVGEGWTSTKAALVDNDVIRRLGSVYEQGYTIPDSRTVQVEKKTNYCADIRDAISMTEIAISSATRGPNDWDHQKMKKEAEHYEHIEKPFFYSKPYAGDKGAYAPATGNTAPSQTGGFEHWLVANANTDLLIDQDDLTMWEYVEYLEAIFDKGSREKFQYSPPAFFTALDKWGLTRVNTYSQEKVLGMAVTKWVRSPGQIVYFVEHDMLKRYNTDLYNNNFILDHGHIGMVVGPAGNTRWRDPLTYKELGGATARKQEIESIVGVHMELPDTHGRLRFKTIS